jgi:hypothetical protein
MKIVIDAGIERKCPQYPLKHELVALAFRMPGLPVATGAI